jgi:hypothetical protein
MGRSLNAFLVPLRNILSRRNPHTHQQTQGQGQVYKEQDNKLQQKRTIEKKHQTRKEKKGKQEQESCKCRAIQRTTLPVGTLPTQRCRCSTTAPRRYFFLEA